MLSEAEHRNEYPWEAPGIAAEGEIGKLSSEPRARRGHRWGGSQGCLRPSSRPFWEDPNKPSIKVQAGGSMKWKSSFISQALCILMLTGMAVAPWQVQWGTAPFSPCSRHALTQVQRKYTASWVKYKDCPEKRKFKRKKNPGVGQPINCQWREKAGKESSWLEPSRRNSVPGRPAFCATLFQKPRSHWSSRREGAGQPRWLFLRVFSFLLPKLR